MNDSQLSVVVVNMFSSTFKVSLFSWRDSRQVVINEVDNADELSSRWFDCTISSVLIVLICILLDISCVGDVDFVVK